MIRQFVKTYGHTCVTETITCYINFRRICKKLKLKKKQISIATFFRFTSKHFRNINNLLLLHQAKYRESCDPSAKPQKKASN
jgi:hypothetical protein